MIKHIKCDIFESGADVICHQVNCQGVMGGGLAKQVREKYPRIFEFYKNRCDDARNKKSLLGVVQFASIGDGRHIANLFAQETFGYDDKCYTDYKALKTCLTTVRDAPAKKDVIAIPYMIGCGLARGDWNVVYNIIQEVFEDSEIEVLICEYKGE